MKPNPNSGDSDYYWYVWPEEAYVGMVGSSYLTGMEPKTGKKAKAKLKAKKQRGFGFSQALEQDDE